MTGARVDREALVAHGGLTDTEFVITAWHIEDGRVVADEKVASEEYRGDAADIKKGVQAVFDLMYRRDPFAPEGCVTKAAVIAALNMPAIDLAARGDAAARAGEAAPTARAISRRVFDQAAAHVSGEGILFQHDDLFAMLDAAVEAGRTARAARAEAEVDREVLNERHALDKIGGEAALIKECRRLAAHPDQIRQAVPHFFEMLADVLAARGNAAPTVTAEQVREAALGAERDVYGEFGMARIDADDVRWLTTALGALGIEVN